MSYSKPYAGLRVLDFSMGVAGPNCGFLLAQYGADVIKVEPPGGDWARALGKRTGDHTALSIPYCVGKRGICLNLKASRGLEIALSLAERADVFIESTRPGVSERLGIGFAAIKGRNPKVIYCSISGFGQAGPYRERPLSDTAAQAFSGLMSVNLGRDGSPTKLNTVAMDVTTGMYAFQAVAAALAGRHDEAEGIHLDISLMSAAAALQATKVVEHYREHGQAGLLNSPAGNYETRDGWIAITLVKEAHFERLCNTLGCPELVTQERFRNFAQRSGNDEALKAQIRPLVAQHETAALEALLQANDVVCNRINNHGDWLDDPHVQAVGAFDWVDVPGESPMPIPRPPASATLSDLSAPTGIGEYTRVVLEEVGLETGAIDRLIADGVVIAG